MKSMEMKRMGKAWTAQRKNREFLILLFAAIGLSGALFLMLWTEFGGNIPDYATHIGHADEEQFIYYLSDSTMIEQTFESPQDFDFATLNFSDHDTTIQGKTFLSVTEVESGQLVEYQEINNAEIHYGTPVTFLKEGGKGGISYSLTITFEEMGEQGLGIYGRAADEWSKAAIINGEESGYAVGIGTHSYTGRFKGLTIAVFLILVLMVVLTVLLVSCSRLPEEYLFLGIAVPMGIVFLMFLSGNSVHDGTTHLAKVYHYSNMLLGQAGWDSSNQVSLRPDEALFFERLFDNLHRENEVAEQFWDISEDFWRKSNEKGLVKSSEFRGTNASSIFEYLPGVLGMTLGRLLGGSVSLNILLAKICFLAFYVMMAFWAIKISPYFKAAIAFVALLPMGMYQAAGITYDSVVIATGLVILAYFFRARAFPLKRYEIGILLGLSGVLGCLKGGFYLPLLLIFLAVPQERQGGKKKKWFLFLGCIVVGGIAMMICSFDAYWSMLTRILGIGMSEVEAEVGSVAVAETINIAETTSVVETVPGTETISYGIAYFFKEPIGFLQLFIRTAIQRAEFYLGGALGYRMAWTDRTVNWIVLLIFCLLLGGAISRVEGQTEPAVSLKERGLVAGIVFLEFLGFHILMLLETPINDPVINGVQGRYFIVLIPLLLFMVYQRKKEYGYSGIRRMFFSYAIAECFYMYDFMKIFLGIG